MTFQVRPATAHDSVRLRAIERAAGERFREVGMDRVADDEPLSEAALSAYAAEGRSWVAEDSAGSVVGYVLADVVDGHAHVEQISVHPSAQGTGIGRALLDRVEDFASDADLGAITLSTFRDVPWNAPLYLHLGFRDLAEDELGPELAALRAGEPAHGLDIGLRVCMRRELQR